MRQTNRTTQRARIPHPAFPPPHSRQAFTLVELLVVIAIIGALVALLLPAVNAARKAAKRAAINAEINQIDAAFQYYQTDRGSYPPNAQVDGGDTNPATPIDDAKVLSRFRRHFKKAFPSHREPDEVIWGLCGFLPPESTNPEATRSADTVLVGGMTAAEALVFWLGGFSENERYPISGEGGPSYSLNGVARGSLPAAQLDPIQERNWRLDIDVRQLGPRRDDGVFAFEGTRWIEYEDPQASGEFRRLQFWTLTARNTPNTLCYFDASRGDATAENDVPAMTQLAFDSVSSTPDAEELQSLRLVHAIKELKPRVDTQAAEFFFANDGKFQILHAGIDESWGVFPRMNPNAPGAATTTNPDDNWMVAGVDPATPVDPNLTLMFPTGPWGLDERDTIANFANGTLGDAQP